MMWSVVCVTLWLDTLHDSLFILSHWWKQYWCNQCFSGEWWSIHFWWLLHSASVWWNCLRLVFCELFQYPNPYEWMTMTSACIGMCTAHWMWWHSGDMETNLWGAATSIASEPSYHTDWVTSFYFGRSLFWHVQSFNWLIRLLIKSYHFAILFTTNQAEAGIFCLMAYHSKITSFLSLYYTTKRKAQNSSTDCKNCGPNKRGVWVLWLLS